MLQRAVRSHDDRALAVVVARACVLAGRIVKSMSRGILSHHIGAGVQSAPRQALGARARVEPFQSPLDGNVSSAVILQE